MNTFYRLYWVSAGLILFVFDLALVVIAGVDVYYFWSRNLDLLDAWELAQSIPGSGTPDTYFLLVVSIVMFSPIAVTLLKYPFRDLLDEYLPETPYWFRCGSLVFHFLIVAPLLVIGWYLYPFMQHLSGEVWTVTSRSTAYIPVYPNFLWAFNTGFLLVVAGNLAKSLSDTTKDSTKIRDVWFNFTFWLRFTFPESDYYPVHGRKLNFNAGGISPEIKAISRRIRAKTRIYQLKVPGSRESKVYLREKFQECADKIRAVLRIPVSEHDDYDVEIYSGTSRAIEVALTRINRPTQVIISPHEHFSEIEVSSWIKSQHLINDLIRVDNIEFSAEDYEEPWARQLLRIKAAIWDIVNSNNNNQPAIDDTDKAINQRLHYVIIFSEVSSITGMFTDAEKFIEEICAIDIVQPLRDEKRVHFVIDASHSVGNHKGAFGQGALKLHQNDLYIFGAHKWLLSPEPLGVVIANPKSDILSIKSYDCWDQAGLPKTTVNATSISGLLSCLEFQLENDNLSAFMRNCDRLKRHFLSDSQGDKFDVVSLLNANLLTSMVCVRPKDGYRWNLDLRGKSPAEKKDRLLKFLSTTDIIAEVVDVDDFSPWVRLTFLYFATASNLKQVRKKLNRAIVSN